MATIILEPNEVHEHSHTKKSESILFNGDVTLCLGKKLLKMQKGKKFFIDANVKHTFINNGKDIASLGCNIIK